MDQLLLTIQLFSQVEELKLYKSQSYSKKEEDHRVVRVWMEISLLGILNSRSKINSLDKLDVQGHPLML